MNSGTSATAKKVAKPAAKRGVYMDFAARGKKPGPVVLRPDARAARQQAARPVGTGGRPVGPDARAAQANARIAQKKAQAEARQRALRLAKAGVPGRAPGLEGTKPQVKVAAQAKAVKPKAAKPVSRVVRPAAKQPAQPVAKQKFVAKPAAEPEPQRPLSRGRVVKPRGATVTDARTAVARVGAVRVTDTPAGRLVEQETYEEIDFGVVEDYQSEKPAATEVKPEVVKAPEKGPNWPFLKSVTVEKRPLSGGKKVATKSRPAPAPTTVTPAASSIALNSGVAKKGSKLPMVGLILLTIILGVAVGAAVYFAIFQGGGPGDV